MAITLKEFAHNWESVWGKLPIEKLNFTFVVADQPLVEFSGVLERTVQHPTGKSELIFVGPNSRTIINIYCFQPRIHYKISHYQYGSDFSIETLTNGFCYEFVSANKIDTKHIASDDYELFVERAGFSAAAAISSMKNATCDD